MNTAEKLEAIPLGKLMLGEEETKPTPKRNLPEGADPMIDTKTALSRPGVLRGETSITIHTPEGLALVRGRSGREDENRQPIIGLLRFSMMISNVEKSVMKDDPYADWLLIKIEKDLNESKAALMQNSEDMQSIMASMAGFNSTMPSSKEPITVPLHFKSTYGFIGAQLLLHYDNLIRVLRLAKHTGFMTPREYHTHLLKAGKPLRRAFSLPLSFRQLGITRKDMIENNAKATRATELYGQLPEDILHKKRRAAFAPDIKTKEQIESEEREVFAEIDEKAKDEK